MNIKHHLLIVVNPKSGSGDKTDLIQQLSNAIKLKEWTYDLYETTGNNDGDAILKCIQKYKTQRLIIVGGDGTINLVAHAIKDNPVLMGIIPAGSANGLALNLNLPETVEGQIETALGDNSLEIDHLNINGQSSLHIADLGLNAELIHNFEASSIRGKLGYLLQTVPTLIHSEGPFTFKIEINGKVMERTGILLAIANAKKYGTGATINPNGKMDDGTFEILIFKELDPIEIVKTMYDKVDLNNNFAECFHTNSVIISTENPVPFQIDGEPQGKTQKVEATLYPKKLIIVVP